METLKSYVDQPTIRFEKKGIDPVVMANILEFIGCSNWTNCIEQKEGTDTRNFITKVSDKYVGNHDYFNRFVAYWEDPKNVRSIFEFLNTC